MTLDSDMLTVNPGAESSRHQRSPRVERQRERNLARGRDRDRERAFLSSSNQYTEADDSSTDPNDPFEKHFLDASRPPNPAAIRSSSFRNEKSRPFVAKREETLTSNSSSSPNLLFPQDDIQLGSSLRAESRDPPLRRVRSFKTTSKGGVINRGDSFRKKSSSRNLSSGCHVDRDSRGGGDIGQEPFRHNYENHDSTTALAAEEPTSSTSYFRVQVIGAPGCGKTSITNQFMASEYANSFDGMNVDTEERTLTVQLDGEETTMEFLDCLPEEDEMDSSIDITADAYIVVYSITDRGTFDAAVQSLYRLRHGMGCDRPIVLVGNKIDLVRKRKVPPADPISISRTYDCRHWETSAALNHHVDELLVAIIKQIRHKLNPEMFPLEPEAPSEPLMKKRTSKGPREFFAKLFRKYTKRKSKKDSK